MGRPRKPKDTETTTIRVEKEISKKLERLRLHRSDRKGDLVRTLLEQHESLALEKKGLEDKCEEVEETNKRLNKIMKEYKDRCFNAESNLEKIRKHLGSFHNFYPHCLSPNFVFL